MLLLVFIAIQFYRPDKNVTPDNHLAIFIAETNPPKEVQQILSTSCYDCHSNATNYPWYNEIVPISFWLDDHIKEGKKHLNFSNWDAYSVKEKDHKLEELVEEVEKNNMPLPAYSWMHNEASLSLEQITQLSQWANTTRKMYQLNHLLK